MSRPVKLISAGVAADPDTRQPFQDKRVEWQTQQGHGPGGSAAQSGAGLHKSGVKLADEPVRRDLGFSQPRGVRLISSPDPRAVAGGPRGIGDEIRDLKAGIAALWKAVTALQRLAGVEIPPEPSRAAVAPSESDADGMRWDDPDLSPQQRIDVAMGASLAALNRGAIKQFRR